MNKLLLLCALCACVLAGSPAMTLLQNEEGENAKNLFLAHAQNPQQGQPGVKVWLTLKRDDAVTSVPLNFPFRSGDKVKFHFQTNFNAYVNIINQGTKGAWQTLYPYAGATELVGQTKGYAIPRDPELWFEFDENPGTEQLVFIFSAKSLAGYGKGPSRLNELTASAGENVKAASQAKDFKLVSDARPAENCAYGLASAQSLQKPLLIRINLTHR